MKPVLIQSVGGNVEILGIDSFVGVLVQSVLIYISSSLRNISSIKRILTGVLSAILMMIFVWKANSSTFIIIGTTLNNCTYGRLLPTMREMIEKTTPVEMRNIAHYLSDIAYGSGAGVVSMLFSGYFIKCFGAKNIALLGLVFMIAPTILCIRKFSKKTNKLH